ncbi:antitoxin MazE family protein [Rhodopila sp.]|jgi:hypothetical protein|uniref:antitoxin MazE family protein n=1 Tax=Rhodopila sp. TaxID=2480087 RepID=UPI002C2664E6|nr:antitoxin MazE family protein [Rhodopila sp.]HVZ06987.1 antitoxin MazE family protein [Rhodopila sp.]
MSKSSNAMRVQRNRDKMRAAGLRPVQIWVPDTRAPGFAEELARQCRLVAAWEATPEGQEEMAFWDQLQAETLAEIADDT